MAGKKSGAARAPRLDYAHVALASLPFMGIFMLLAIAVTRHGDTVLIDEVARREQEAA